MHVQTEYRLLPNKFRVNRLNDGEVFLQLNQEIIKGHYQGTSLDNLLTKLNSVTCFFIVRSCLKIKGPFRMLFTFVSSKHLTVHQDRGRRYKL